MVSAGVKSFQRHELRRHAPVAAVALAEWACAAGPANYALRATLAAAYAEAGRFDDALREARAAEAGAFAAGDQATAAEERRRSALYARGEALRIG